MRVLKIYISRGIRILRRSLLIIRVKVGCIAKLLKSNLQITLVRCQILWCAFLRGHARIWEQGCSQKILLLMKLKCLLRWELQIQMAVSLTVYVGINLRRTAYFNALLVVPSCFVLGKVPVEISSGLALVSTNLLVQQICTGKLNPV